MAVKSTIFKVHLQIADMDRGYYEPHALTIARHPSETNERMMLRVLAFALCADERLEFGGGVSTPDEPDLWRKSLSGEIEQWIDLGLPDPRRIAKACGRAEQVRIYLYGGQKAETWWDQECGVLRRHRNLSVTLLAAEQTEALGAMADRGISPQCNIQDGEIWVMCGAESVHITPRVLLGA